MNNVFDFADDSANNDRPTPLNTLVVEVHDPDCSDVDRI